MGAMKRRDLLLAFVLTFVTAPAGATVLAKWDLAEVTRRADLIVVGTIEAQRYVEAGELMTESVVRVESTLHGAPAKRIVLSQLGGRKGRIITEIDGDARLAVGDRVLLYTYRHEDGRRYLVGMSLGAYQVEAKSARQTIDVPLVDRSGALSPPPGVRSIDLELVRSTIRQVHP